mgnify:CR=1 FL=1
MPRKQKGDPGVRGISEDLSADRAIRRQLSNHERAIDRLDVSLWQSVWHPGGTIEDENKSLRGVARDIAQTMVRSHQPWIVHSHQLTAASIDISGDRATSEAHVSATLRRPPDPSGRVFDDHLRLRYLDRWSRREGRWAIDHRKAPAGIRWTELAHDPANGLFSRRDREDPSYGHFASIAGDGDQGPVAWWAERDIRRQLQNYCHAVDRFDVAMWRRVWHPDAILDYRDVGEKGHALDMHEYFTLGHMPWATHTHQITSSIIKVCDEVAVSETYSMNLLFSRQDATGEPMNSHYRGRYLDRWSKREGRWAIDHRWAVNDFRWRTVNRNASVGPRVFRDHDDPYYDLVPAVR